MCGSEQKDWLRSKVDFDGQLPHTVGEIGFDVLSFEAELCECDRDQEVILSIRGRPDLGRGFQ